MPAGPRQECHGLDRTGVEVAGLDLDARERGIELVELGGSRNALAGMDAEQSVRHRVQERGVVLVVSSLEVRGSEPNRPGALEVRSLAGAGGLVLAQRHRDVTPIDPDDPPRDFRAPSLGHVERDAVTLDLRAGTVRPARRQEREERHARGDSHALDTSRADTEVPKYPPTMRGAIAAGHRLTAEAGARLLEEGGNAVDACLAAAFVSWVAESPLTGPGGGGFLLVHDAHDGRSRLLDFFVTVPGEGLRRGTVGQMETVDVDFDDTIQAFRIGAASVAVPGTVAGLDLAHRKFGSVPWPKLFEPAIELARSGFELTREQAYLHAILDIILRHTEEGRVIYGRDGERLAAGDRVEMADLAETLETLAAGRGAAFYQGPLARAVSDHVRAHGGTLTREDMAAYRPIWRRPIQVEFAKHHVVSNPPPSSGGVLIAYGLRLLDSAGLGGPPGSAEAIARLVEVMGEQETARGPGFQRELFRGGLAQRLCDEQQVSAAAGRLLTGTTHISAVDARGNAASLTATTGSGSGCVVPGTGVHLNNMLGEFDLTRTTRRPGGRLTSGMAPSVALQDGRPRLVVGSAGSLRLRGAILQTIVNVIGHGLTVEEAIDAPRVHVEDGHVHLEGGTDAAAADDLERRGYDVVPWRRRNLYFGGAAAVGLLPDGTLHAAGDPRRGGHGIVVGA